MTLSFKFGTVGSPAGTPSRPGGTVGGIQYSASLGLDALELAWVHGVRISAPACEAIKRAAEETGLALSVHAPYFINLNGEEEKWPRLRQYLIDAAHFGNLAGATDIIFHPGTYFGKPADEVLKVILPRLQDCMDEIRADGNLVSTGHIPQVARRPIHAGIAYPPLGDQLRSKGREESSRHKE